MGAPTKLAVATAGRIGPTNTLRTGKVVSVSTAGVVVNVAGGLVTCSLVGGAGAGVAPGAIVSVFRQGSSWQVQGVINGPGQGTDTPTQPVPSTNSVILPPASSSQSAAQCGIADTTIASGVTSGSGVVFINVSVYVTLPKGHLCEVRVAAYTGSASASNTTTVLSVREGPNYSTGTSWANTEMVFPNAGNGQHFSFSGYNVGDGNTHLLGLCLQVLTAGPTVNITRSTRSFIGVIDWGDASGVIQI